MTKYPHSTSTRRDTEHTSIKRINSATEQKDDQDQYTHIDSATEINSANGIATRGAPVVQWAATLIDIITLSDTEQKYKSTTMPSRGIPSSDNDTTNNDDDTTNTDDDTTNNGDDTTSSGDGTTSNDNDTTSSDHDTRDTGV